MVVSMSERKIRPYRVPEEKWRKAFLESFVLARVDERSLSSSFSLTDELGCEQDERFGLFGRVELGEGVVGTRFSIHVRSVSAGLHHDIHPPFRGIGLLSYLPQDAMRQLERPRPEQLESMEASDLFRALERYRNAEDQLEAEVFAESSTYERLRRIAVESASWERVELLVSLGVGGLADEWTREAPIVSTELRMFTRPRAE